MAKKKKHKPSFAKHRNAAPRPPGVPRAPRAARPESETSMHRLGYTAAGAAEIARPKI